MTGYMVASTSVDLAILAVTYELRIALINLYTTGGGDEFVTVTRHNVSTLSGGSLADIVPLFQGAPAATAVARSGSLTFSGTSEVIGKTNVGAGSSFTTIGSTVIQIKSGSTGTIQSPLTMTIAPGSVIHVSGTSLGITAQIYFEEVRLAGSY